MIYELDGVQPELKGDGHFVAESASVIGQVLMKPKSSVWFSSVVRADVERIVIGECTNVQDGAVLHADPGFPLLIGDYVTIGHQAMVHGCTVGNNTLIGINAVILNGAKVGDNCLIGANALITEGKEIPDGSLVMGAPAKVVRTLNDDEQAMLRLSASRYADNAAHFQKTLKPIG